jgi:hypothetical protein
MSNAYFEQCDFDHDIYRTNYPDLAAMSNEDLENHFLQYGIGEGRIYNAITSRKHFVDRISKDGKMLEIGPLDNPQLNHTSPLYYSLDVFDKDQLINNYINDPSVNKEKIIEPSYVIVNNDYSQIKYKFQSIFSSHNIEHMPCVVTFLNNLENILNDDGYIYLVIPDKRYCFDHFKKETDVYDVLQLYNEKSTRPRLSAILKMSSQMTHSDPQAHWDNNHGTIDDEHFLLQNYTRIVNRFNTGVYIDAHVSYFTPQSFMQIINVLNKLKLINLEIHKIYHTLRGYLEFYIILKKSITN